MALSDGVTAFWVVALPHNPSHDRVGGFFCAWGEAGGGSELRRGIGGVDISSEACNIVL